MLTGETLQGEKKANKWQLAHGRSVQLLHKVLLHSASSLLLIWCRGNPRSLSSLSSHPSHPCARGQFPGETRRGEGVTASRHRGAICGIGRGKQSG